jgi:hypothetical protein
MLLVLTGGALLFPLGSVALLRTAGADDKPPTQLDVVANNERGDKFGRIRGKVAVVSGKTLRFADGTEVDLNIEYPEPDAQGSKLAVEFLKKLVGDQEVTCFQPPGLPLRGPRSRWVGYVGDTKIEHAMVINGWAIAGHSGMRPAEMIAREKKRGLWADSSRAAGANQDAEPGAAAPQQFQGGVAALDPPCMPIFAKVTQASLKDGRIDVSWCTSGRHKLPAGERGTDGKTVRYSYLGCYGSFDPRNARITQADGKIVKLEDAWKKLSVGTAVVVSMDANDVSKEFLARLKEDTIVIQIDAISLTESTGKE